MRKDLINWNKKVFGKVENEIQLKQAQLQSIQNSILTVDDVKKEKMFREELETLMHKKEVMWSQKAKCNWLILGDKNTRYFQTMVKQRRARSRILQLKFDDGEVIEDHEGIKQLLLQHFTQAYERTTTTDVDHILEEIRTLPIPQISNQQNLALTTPVTNEEIEFTIFQLRPYKAPGLDGIPTFFYQEYWDLVKYDIFNYVQAFFHSGYLLKTLNQTFITLILKKFCPDNVNHFRPISLCNVIFKVISKILVNRLKPLMDCLITPFQNAFSKRRNISDNILIAHEIFDMMSKMKGRKGCFEALKIDMSKAYDRLDWSFLQVVLLAMNFSPNWVGWIMECVTTMQYTLLVNRCITQSFTPSKGLR